MNKDLLKQIYRTVSDELSILGLTVVNKSIFLRNSTTDFLKIRLCDIRNVAHDLNAWGMANIDANVELCRTVAKEMTNEFGEMVFDLGQQNTETVTDRKYQIDKLLGHVKDNLNYIEYVRNELRKTGKGFKNCLILSDNEPCYQFVDDLMYVMRKDCDTQPNGNIIFYDKGMKYNVPQSLYFNYCSGKKLYANKLLFIYYNNFLGSVTYNDTQNEFYETDGGFNPKIVLNYYYKFDTATYKTVTVEVPEKYTI